MDFTPILATVLIQYQALAAPVLVPPAASTAGGGPSPLTSAVPTIQYQAYAAPVVVPSQIVSPVAGASAHYPSRVPAKRRLHASLHPAFVFDRFAAPTPVAAPDLPPQAHTVPIRRTWSVARAAQWQPEFGVQVDVPVMSWTGHAPDTLPHFTKRRHASRAQTLAWDTVLFPDVVVAPDLAHPIYPDRIFRTPKLRAYPQPSWPPFVADTTVVVPVSSWQAEHPDWIAPKHGIHASRAPFFRFNPEPVPVIAVSHLSGGRGYYVVPRRPRTFTVPPHWRTFSVN